MRNMKATYTPARLAALRSALRIEATRGGGLALACLAAIRPALGDAVCADKAARLATMLRSGDATTQAMWRRVCDRARRQMRMEATA